MNKTRTDGRLLPHAARAQLRDARGGAVHEGAHRRVLPPLLRRGGRRRRRAVAPAARTTTSSAPTATTPTTSSAAATRARRWPNSSATPTAAARARAARCTSSTGTSTSSAATPSSPACARSPSGSAWPSSTRGEDRVVLCFFGDGATNQGVYHESLNMAALYKLPVVWVCENNQYAIGTSVARSSAARVAGAEGRAPTTCRRRYRGRDGLLQDAVGGRAGHRARARRARGRRFIEAKCYRYRGHSMSDPATYRTQGGGRVLEEPRPDPAHQGRHQARLRGRRTRSSRRLTRRCARCSTRPSRFAESGHQELPLEELYEDLYAERAESRHGEDQLPRRDQPGALRGDAARRVGHRLRRGRGPLRRLVQGHARAC